MKDEANRHKFPTHSPDGATVFDLVTGDDICRVLPLVGGLQHAV